jgi:cellulose synthase/poly-beta-1,6-N-acetylglucosamine synthase-like glycosyltransferase
VQAKYTGGLKISCICPTYGRSPSHQWLLEESIESFLKQDYPDKELIVFNDSPGQELCCDAAGVVVINLPTRFRSLGEKYNAAIRIADGDMISPWEDDDIMLPWRLTASRHSLGNADYYNPFGYWLLDGGGLHTDHPIGVSHSCSIFTRKAFDLTGGYPHISGAQDQGFHGRLTGHPDVRCVKANPLTPREWYYIYRWGISPIHLSSRLPHDSWYEEIGRNALEPGQYTLRPHWRSDYRGGCASYLKGLGSLLDRSELQDTAH